MNYSGLHVVRTWSVHVTVEPPIKDTPYGHNTKKPLYKGHAFLLQNNDFPILSVYCQPLRRGHLSIKDILIASPCVNGSNIQI